MGSKSSSGKVLAILALIIGASGLGLGVFSFIQIQTGVTGPSKSIIVGHWESLYRDMDNPDFNTTNNWLIEVGDNKIENSDYVILNQSTQHSNTRFHLIKSGWYRVNLHVMLWNVSDALGLYRIYVLKNGSIFLFLLYEARASINQNLQVNRQFYISSDGNDYFEFNCYNENDDFLTDSQHPLFNQLTIEYVGEY